MNDWELIFTMLGEKATTDITKARDAQNFPECQKSAQRGGEIAKNARQELEQETGHLIESRDNYLHLTEKIKTQKYLNKPKKKELNG